MVSNNDDDVEVEARGEGENEIVDSGDQLATADGGNRKKAAANESPSSKRATASSASNDEAETDDESLPLFEGPLVVPKKPFVFQRSFRLPPYKWKLPNGETAINPAVNDVEFIKLLLNDAFIDKSAAIHNFLKCWFDVMEGDFESAALHVVFPRRFAKATLLQFIEAVYSPVKQLNFCDPAQIKTKIASLKKGKELLKFGMHPVVWLDMQGMLEVESLNRHIGIALQRAGLKNVVVDMKMSPRDHLLKGVTMLNENFLAEFNVATKTIVLIDEHDKPFRDITLKEDDEFLKALIQLYGLGKEKNTGISLFILCGLTRMVGTGLSGSNNLFDISRQNKFHGLCGISVREFIDSCEGELDQYARKNHSNQTLSAVLKSTFVPQWDGFRFGIDDEPLAEGQLDPQSLEGALFSPLDAWEVVEALVKNAREPSSKWIDTMSAEFEFTNFARRYTDTREASFQLRQCLFGGLVKKKVLTARMKRKEYFRLGDGDHVKKVLFELGLLSVINIDGTQIWLGSPNWRVTIGAMKLLVEDAIHGPTPYEFAISYMDENTDFRTILAEAANEYTNMHAQTGPNVAREYGLQDYLFKQLLIRFPDESNYKLFKEMQVYKVDHSRGRIDIGVALCYENTEYVGFIIEVKMEKGLVTESDEEIRTVQQEILAIAKEQVKTYVWPQKEAPVSKVRRVAVSGVWHSSRARLGSFELSVDSSFD